MQELWAWIHELFSIALVISVINSYRAVKQKKMNTFFISSTIQKPTGVLRG